MAVEYKRLTNIEKYADQRIFWKKNLGDIYNKLSQYEDIEELCEKISLQKVYQKLDDGSIIEDDYSDCSILYNFKENRFEMYEYDFINWLEIDKYKIEWAFSREELENE